MSTAWTSRYAARTKGLTSSAIRDLLKVIQKPGMISFAGGLPAPDVFPAQRFAEACHKVLTENASQALQYGATEGYERLRELIANNMARYGIKARIENVLITSGSQQALDLIGKLFINAGDHVLVEAPTYLGALQAFNVYGAEYLAVPSDENGLRTDLLEAPLRSGPKFMYVLPNFQNPAGRRSPRAAVTNLCYWPTGTAFRLSKTILTASYAMKGSIFRRWSCSTARTCGAITAIRSAT